MDGDFAPPRRAVGLRYRQVVSALDLDEVFANMPKWQIEHEILSRPDSPSSNGVLLLDEIGVASNRMGGRVRATGSTPAGQLAIGVEIASPPGRRFGGRRLGADDALVGYGGAELDYLLPAGLLDLSIILPGSAVEASLEQRLGVAVDLARFRSARVADARRATHPGLWRLFRHLAQVLHGEAEAPEDAQALGHLRAEVLDAVSALVGGYLESERSPDRSLWHHRRPVALRAAAFMRANLGQAITLADVCVAARASLRTVEYAFNDLYGLGAQRYLRILRLHEVRRRLRSHAPPATSIQVVARDLGFWHMGHFGAGYRALFGETPTATLGRRPGGAGVAALRRAAGGNPR